MKRKRRIDPHPDLVRFFEGEVGLTFLHRLVAALCFAFTKVGNAGVRDVVRFFELSGLSDFAASSVGSQQKVSEAVDEAIARST